MMMHLVFTDFLRCVFQTVNRAEIEELDNRNAHRLKIEHGKS